MAPDDLVLYTAQEVADLLRMNHQVIQRKLQAGEIPGYRIGREWRVERAQLLSWLASHSNQGAPRTKEDAILSTFLDTEGRVRQLPAQRSKREVVLRHIVTRLETDRVYREKELNDELRRVHDDVASLRRLLVEHGLLLRTSAGVYKRPGSSEPLLRRG